MATQITLQAGQTLSVGDADYVIDASAGNDTIVAGNGNDLVTGGMGDTITLGNGNDSVIGGSNESISVGNGNDTITAVDTSSRSSSSITAGDGNDTITGGNNGVAGSYRIATGNGNDTIIAGQNEGGIYSISVGSGNDTIIAGQNEGGIYSISVGSGNDVIVAGGGNTINLGSGTDSVVMNTAVAATGDTISGFGGSDQIDLSYLAFGANTTIGYAPNNSNTGGTLTIDDHSGNIANIALLGQYVAGSFALSSDGHGGTLVTDPAVIAQNENRDEEQGGTILAGAREMLWTKLMFEPLKEAWENRNYFGYNIRDENAPWYKQIWQTIVHGFGDTTPISMSSAQRALDTGGTCSKDVVLAVLGFGPAPAYAEKSAIQNRIAHLYNQHVAREGQRVTVGGFRCRGFGSLGHSLPLWLGLGRGRCLQHLPRLPFSFTIIP